ncbi:enoyl-CoA hydratase/isomerase family protein [Sphingobium xenophagum]|nr:enoyl-CoA hydratase/isomerase family protein [Sphingobium xenophagum]
MDKGGTKAAMILSADALALLAASHPAPEDFGPRSERPCLAFALAGSDAGLADWLCGLPCPVVGVGAGPLASACDVVLADETGLAAIIANVAVRPFAAMLLVQQLRLSEQLPMAAALTAESLAFATIQRGGEFLAWRAGAPAAPSHADEAGPPVIVEMEGSRLMLRLNRPARFNAVNVAMRDALYEVLRVALLDPAITTIQLSGAGRCFSVGGDVAEFGLSHDVAEAHWVRTLRLPATLLAQLAPRVTAHVHGAVVGAGVEMAAFAGRVEARADSWFQLPELKYGLLPGAGGTVSLPRRIGRQKTAYMALSMRRIPASLALEWGLVDAIVP